MRQASGLSFWLNKSTRFFALIALLWASGCGYTTPTRTTPAPSEQYIEKSVFRKADGTPKTFVCAWAPLSEVGMIAEYTTVHNATMLPACNVQFLIEQDNLVGKQVNPSAPPRDWATVITIPIASHFDRVARRDKFNRETNEMINETDRHDWSARSQMSLRWGGMQVHDFAYELLYGGHSIQAVNDVEISSHNGKTFVGFSIGVSSPIFGRLNQAQFRVNFLEFDSEPVESFQPRRYHDDNSNHFGALWGMGREVNGSNPVQFVARWDLRPQAIPHEVCLNGFEGQPTARRIAEGTIDEWNAVLNRIGAVPAGQKAFVVSSRTYQHPFDLRCPSITYIADRRLSEKSPLGIAMAQADVMNGKILWGGMVIYGGALEQYVESYRGTNSLASIPEESVYSERVGRFVFGSNPLSTMNIGVNRAAANLGQFGQRMGRAENIDLMRTAMNRMGGSSLQRMSDLLGQEGIDASAFQRYLRSGQVERTLETVGQVGNEEARGRMDQSALDEWSRALGMDRRALMNLQMQTANLLAQAQGRSSAEPGSPAVAEAIEGSLQQAVTAIDHQRALMNGFLGGDNWLKLMLGDQAVADDALVNEATFGPNWRQLSVEEKERVLLGRRQGILGRMQRANVVDMDNTIEQFVGDLRNAPSDLQQKTTEEIVAISIKKTLLHEFGHMIGLAHNFEDNIMPKEGSVPPRYFGELKAERDRPYHQNVSTIMGYPHPYQMLVKGLDDVKAGYQDELVLRYLYKNEYPTYNGTDEDFTFRPVPNDGRIPRSGVDLGNGYKVSYFPNCTDYMELLGLSPYCNKWDRGYDARTITSAYLEDFQNNWIPRLSNLADSGTNPFYATYYLWRRSLNNFSRVRKFYDYMRYQYREEIARIGGVDRSGRRQARRLADSRNYFDFKDCAGPDQRNEYVKRVFQEADPEFAELCEVNKMVVSSLGEFLTDEGPDFTTFNNNLRAAPVNDFSNDPYQSWSRMWGTWVDLGVLPIKFSALFTLTSPMSFFTYGSYVLPNRLYSRSGQNSKYTYASLYPAEFTRAVSSGVIGNIRLNAKHGEEPKINRTALFMGSFLYDTFSGFESTNDFQAGFDRDYLNTIRNQTNFNFNYEMAYVPIFVQTVRSREANEEPDRVKAFTALVYEWGNRVIELGDAFPMPDGKVVFSYSPRTFIYPVTDMLFLGDDFALVWGIRVTYDPDQLGNLGPVGLKQQLYNEYMGVVDSCIKGARLRDWFNKSNTNFKGFKIIPGIAGNENRYQAFSDSVQEEYEKYWAHPDFGRNDPERRDVCKKSLHDIGLIITQALAMKNIWMPQITSYIVK